MEALQSKFEQLLSHVQKPSRYIGNEWNLPPIKHEAPIRFLFMFPDVYEIGMSNLGLQVLFNILADRTDVLVDRCFTPWIDMEQLMRDHSVPLHGIQSKIPAHEFDILGFTLQYELNYTNVLTMLDLAGIPFRAVERNDRYPLIIGGGPCANNPEPVADFFDGFLLGDGEEALPEIINTYAKVKKETSDRNVLLKELAQIPGFYVPRFFEPVYSTDGVIKNIIRSPLQPTESINKRVVKDLDSAVYPVNAMVPLTSVIHDRVSLEVARGCLHICRFCPASVTSKPLRFRSLEQLEKLAIESIKQTGHSEISLNAFNLPDYPHLNQLVSHLMQWCAPHWISLAIPSIRPGGLNPELIKWINSVRKTGFTIAPEAGSSRLRAIINKNVSDEHLLINIRDAFALGWSLIKLYFMIGLPYERDIDIDGIVTLTRQAVAVGKNFSPRNAHLNLSISPFVPKPHTTFQWFPQESMEMIKEKQHYLRSKLPRKSVTIKTTVPEVSRLEAILSNGDRRLSRVIETAWKSGSRYEGWTELFRFDVWEQALAAHGLSIDFYVSRRKPFDEILPWNHLQSPSRQRYLVEDCQQCVKLSELPFPAQETIDIKTIIAEEKLQGQPKPMPQHVYKPPIQLIRAVYQKTGIARFLSHLDCVRIFTLALNRAQIPITYSAGFNPHPKISYGPPLPLGYESLEEYIDFYFNRRMGVEQFLALMNTQLPDGIRFIRGRVLPPESASITSSIQSILYRVSIPSGVRAQLSEAGNDIWQRMQNVFQTDTIIISQLDFDLKLYVSLHNISPEQEPNIHADLLLREGAPSAIRLSELLSNLFQVESELVKEIRLIRFAAFSDANGERSLL